MGNTGKILGDALSDGRGQGREPQGPAKASPKCHIVAETAVRLHFPDSQRREFLIHHACVAIL